MSSIRWIASAAKANVWHLWILKIGLFMTPGVAMALDMIIQNMPRKYEWEFILPKGRSNEAKHFGHKNPAIAGYSDYCRLIKMVAKKNGV